MPASYGQLKFAEQIAFFLRKMNVPTQAWTDVMDAEHDIAFMVAGANRDDLLADFNQALLKVIRDGATLAQFRKDFDRIVATYGWEYTGGREWRSRVIYETNLRQSYNAGRWAQLQKSKKALPYWRYRHSDSVEHPRPLHESWDGLVLSADDPWWHTHYPANGWGCQCYVEGISNRALRLLGKTGPDTAPPINLQTVTIGQRSPGGPRSYVTPEGIDPGFGYAPGRSLGALGPLGPEPSDIEDLVANTAQSALGKTLRLPADIAADSASGILGIARVLRALQLAYVDWQASVGAQAARTSAYTVGALEPAAVRSLRDAGVDVGAAVIVIRDIDLALPSLSGLPQLPTLLRSPVAVLLDRPRDVLLYVVKGEGDELLGISVAYTPATALAAAPNRLAGAERVSAAALQARVNVGELQLLQGQL